MFGDNLSQPLYPATKLIKDMSEEEVWHEYILYIGAGAVAAGVGTRARAVVRGRALV